MYNTRRHFSPAIYIQTTQYIGQFFISPNFYYLKCHLLLGSVSTRRSILSLRHLQYAAPPPTPSSLQFLLLIVLFFTPVSYGPHPPVEAEAVPHWKNGKCVYTYTKHKSRRRGVRSHSRKNAISRPRGAHKHKFHAYITPALPVVG